MNNIIGCIARCTVCEWEDGGQFTAKDAAKLHAKQTGHYVIGEQTIAFDFGKQRTERAPQTTANTDRSEQ